MIILQPHLCPRCRVSQDEWKVKGSNVKKKIRIGDPWPKYEPLSIEAVDKCNSCGLKLRGSIVVVLDENGDPKKISHVKDVNDD